MWGFYRSRQNTFCNAFTSRELCHSAKRSRNYLSLNIAKKLIHTNHMKWHSTMHECTQSIIFSLILISKSIEMTRGSLEKLFILGFYLFFRL
jgi:hypothetical protein